MFLPDRESFIPEVLSKNTNSAPVRAAFAQASAPPALWKIDSMVGEECTTYYSDPGFFFQVSICIYTYIYVRFVPCTIAS